MFKFNFAAENDEKETVKEEKTSPQALKESKRIEVSSGQYEEIAQSLSTRSFQMFTSNDIEIGFVDNVKVNENSESDLISGVYEGGYKIWECTQDMADFLLTSKKDEEEDEVRDLKEKNVCDLGCSAGILGLLALLKGAKLVHFQDYNEDVLENFTIPNTILCCEENEAKESFSKCSFYSGDWDSFRELTTEKYDTILTSETIYNPQNYSKLLEFFKSRLKKSGKVFLAAKAMYFGVGGNTFDFCKFLEKDESFIHETVWKSSEGLQREILVLQWRQ